MQNSQNNYLLTKTDEKVAITSNLELNDSYVYFRTENKEKKKGYDENVYKDKQMKMLEFDGRVFMVLPDGRGNYIQEVVCFNDKYILTGWFYGGSGLFIKVYDLSFNSVYNFKPLRVGKKYQLKDIEEHIKPYFGDCANVTDVMVKTINDDDKTQTLSGRTVKAHMLVDIYAVKCNHTSKSINDWIKAFLALPAAK